MWDLDCVATLSCRGLSSSRFWSWRLAQEGHGTNSLSSSRLAGTTLPGGFASKVADD